MLSSTSPHPPAHPHHLPSHEVFLYSERPVKVRGDRGTKCARDEQEHMALQHELLESKLVAEYQLFRQSMSPLTTPGKSEETLRYEWMAENFNRVKRRVC